MYRPASTNTPKRSSSVEKKTFYSHTYSSNLKTRPLSAPKIRTQYDANNYGRSLTPSNRPAPLGFVLNPNPLPKYPNYPSYPNYPNYPGYPNYPKSSAQPYQSSHHKTESINELLRKYELLINGRRGSRYHSHNNTVNSFNNNNNNSNTNTNTVTNPAQLSSQNKTLPLSAYPYHRGTSMNNPAPESIPKPKEFTYPNYLTISSQQKAQSTNSHHKSFRPPSASSIQKTNNIMNNVYKDSRPSSAVALTDRDQNDISQNQEVTQLKIKNQLPNYIKTFTQNNHHNTNNDTTSRPIISSQPPIRSRTAPSQRAESFDPMLNKQSESPETTIKLDNKDQLQTNFGTSSTTTDILASTIDHYNVGKVIGEGSYGKVQLGYHILTNQIIAIKKYEKNKIKDKHHYKRILQEITVMNHICHQNLMHLFESFESSYAIYLIVEYCGGTNLCSYVKEKKRLSEFEARGLFQQIVNGILYLHRKSIIHRDIKLENVLFDVDHNVKIGDFGFSVHVKDETRLLAVFCGTPTYMAPEIVKREKYSGKPVDIWSLAVVLYAMVVGKFPFSAKSYPELYKRIMQGNIVYPDFLSSTLVNLLNQMFQMNPKTRITIEIINSHPWLQLDHPKLSDMQPIISKEIELDKQVVKILESEGFALLDIEKSVYGKKRDYLSTTYYLYKNKLLKQKSGKT